jgi:hypothetical protein
LIFERAIEEEEEEEGRGGSKRARIGNFDKGNCMG